MTPEQQSWAAGAIVLLTAAVFAWRHLRGRKRKGCGGGCACPAPPANAVPKPPPEP